MKKSISLNLKTWVLLSLAVFTGSTFTGCQDDVDQGNRFTFTGEVISSHLQNNPEKYSHFVGILEKASIGKKSQSTMLETMSTYGAYTCIAPVNPAVEKFVQEQYDIYIKSVENNKIDPEKFPIIETGVTSPNVEDLTVEKCTEIAKNHIIEEEFKTINFHADYALPKKSMNYRTVMVDSDVKDGERKYYLGVNRAEIIEYDINTYNGTIHSISEVLNPSTENAAEELSKSDGISIFREALMQTGLDKLLAKYEIDKDYDETATPPKFGDFDTKLPPSKFQKYTLLVEPNEVLMNPDNNYWGMEITTWEELAEFAEKIYGSAPGVEKIYTHPKNALFKFIAYHIIDRQLGFVAEGATGGWIMEGYKKNGFDSEANVLEDVNRNDYFETYLPYSNWEYTDEEIAAIAEGDVDEGCMIKVTRCFTDEHKAEFGNNIVLNLCNSTPSDIMKYHTNVIVYKQSDATSMFPETLKDLALEPENASIHMLSKILVYNDDEMLNNVLNERMRWDAMSLFPELTSNDVRWDSDPSIAFTYLPAGGHGDDSQLHKQYSKRLIANNNSTECFYGRPHPTGKYSWTSFQGDELLIEGKFDAEIRLPHVPAGTDYEIRLGFSMSTRRGVIQFYLNDIICDIPTDMRMDDANKNRIGWFSDTQTDGGQEKELTEEEIKSKENAMRNRGYMKGPNSILYGTEKEPFRKSDNSMRRIIVTNYDLTPRKDGYWLRVKNVTEKTDGNHEFNFDYLEIVPKSIYDNMANPEDRN